MQKGVDRRGFLRTAIGCAGSAAVGLVGLDFVMPEAVAQFRAQRMTWKMNGFTAAQQTSINNIMRVLVNRFFDRRVHSNMDAVATQWKHGNDYFPKTRLPNNKRQR